MADDPTATNPASGPTIAQGRTSIPVDVPPPRPTTTRPVSFTDQQISELVSEAEQHDPELAARMKASLAGEGYEIDSRTQEQLRTDYNYNVPADGDYQAYDPSAVVPQSVLADPDMAPTLPAWSQEAQELGNHLRMPPEMFKGLIKALFDEGEKFRSLGSDIQKQNYLQEQQNIIRQIFDDPDDLADFKEEVETMFNSLGNNSIAKAFKDNALRSAVVAGNLRAYVRHMHRYLDVRGDR